MIVENMQKMSNNQRKWRNEMRKNEKRIRRHNAFTLIEIMIVVGIIAIMLASAVMSVASGRGAVQAKEATRGVVQLSRYASALALLRQRPVVVTFHKKGKVEVRISGEATGSGAAGQNDAFHNALRFRAGGPDEQVRIRAFLLETVYPKAG